MKVAIPSKGRAKNWISYKHFTKSDIYLFVEPQDYIEYKKHNKGYNIINIGENDKGIAFVRNFIINFFGGGLVLVCDDDIVSFKNGEREIKGEELMQYIDEFGHTIKMSGFFQGGFSFFKTDWMKKNVYDYNCKNCGVVILNLDLFNLTNIRYDENLGVFEDVEIILAFFSIGIGNICDNRIIYETFGKGEKGYIEGGCVNDWEIKKSQKAFLILKKKYGGLVWLIIRWKSFFNYYQEKYENSNTKQMKK